MFTTVKVQTKLSAEFQWSFLLNPLKRNLGITESCLQRKKNYSTDDQSRQAIRQSICIKRHLPTTEIFRSLVVPLQEGFTVLYMTNSNQCCYYAWTSAVY